jgi:hypothetical protein
MINLDLMMFFKELKWYYLYKKTKKKNFNMFMAGLIESTG